MPYSPLGSLLRRMRIWLAKRRFILVRARAWFGGGYRARRVRRSRSVDCGMQASTARIASHVPHFVRA